MNWLLVGIVALIAAPFLVIIGNRQPREGAEAPQLVQYGYLAGIIGLFILLVQWMSISAAMLIFLLGTGVIWAFDKWMHKARADKPRPDWAEYGRGFFPVLLVVFVLRAFVVEPYQIPSSSMRPGLVVGDFILVNKFTYGLRVPILNTVFAHIGSPQHGDVMVFNHPDKPEINLIKRVIGVPGDTVEYRNKQLYINGVALPTQPAGEHDYIEGGDMQVRNLQFAEKHGEHLYNTLQAIDNPPAVNLAAVEDFQYRENCQYDTNAFTCKVPEGHYFMMGDNRDHSGDGRYFGFVPDKYVVGKAFFVWFNLGHLNRIGTVIH